MSNAHRHYRAIHPVLMQLFGNPTGHKARHVQTLTVWDGCLAFIGGNRSQYLDNP
jgi:hypothetical protein